MDNKLEHASQLVEQAEKPDNTSHLTVEKSCGTPRKENAIDEALKDQMKTDPVEKGPFLSVDNSPHTIRNVSVMKARLREQESRHMLEMVRLKKEYELKEERLNEELSTLRTSISAIKKDLEMETKLKTDAVRRDEQSTKDLAAISGKCAELQGRLTENHAALKESRAYTESLFAIHEAKLAEIRRENAESEGKHFDAKQALERKVRDLEDQLTETRSAFQRVIAEKSEKWKETEAELTDCLKQEKVLTEKLSKENVDLNERLSQKKVELKETYEGWESAKAEVKDLMEFHRMELMNMREEHGKLQQEWDEQVQRNVAELLEAKEEFSELKEVHDALVAEYESSVKKYEESVKVLKDALTVLDEQNKELTLEVKRMQDLIEDKDKLRGTLNARVEELQLQVEKAELEKQDLLLEKSKLEEEVATKSQTIVDTVSSKDAEISAIQKELSSVKADIEEEMEFKDARITTLESALEDLKLDMEDRLCIKDEKIQGLAKELEDERKKVASNAEELARMKDSLQVLNAQLDEVTLKYEKSNQRVSKLNLEMSRLINEVVNVKEENIDLKSGMNEALQKGDFYKDRNNAYTEQLAELQREKADREAELLADIEEKKSLIEYLQGQVAASTAGGNDKKKRRFFQTKPTEPSSPMRTGSPTEDTT